jgi:hypothetical protein
LKKAKLITDREGVKYIDTARLFLLIKEKKSWKELGMNRLIGSVTLRSTDPTRSNSGFLVFGLIAIMMNNGGMIDEMNVERFAPEVKNIYTRMGFLENSTGILFRKFLEQGMGAYPIIAAYESLIIEYYLDPNYKDAILKNIIPPGA